MTNNKDTKSDKKTIITLKELKCSTYNEIEDIHLNSIDVLFLSLPSYKMCSIGKLLDTVFYIHERIKKECHLLIYSDNETLALLCYGIEKNTSLKYKTWISIRKEMHQTENRLPNETKGLVIFNQTYQSLNILPIRLPYTYCPACNKTTKDYGGKKHLFDSYGTLMSDVWKDFTVTENDEMPKLVLNRVKEMFSIEPNRVMVSITLHDFDWDSCSEQLVEYPELDSDIDNKEENTIIDSSKLMNGDVLEEIRKIPSNSIDYIFVDPPYNLKKKYTGYHDNLEIEEYFKWCDKWLSECHRVLKPGRYLSVLNLPLWSVRHYAFLQTKMEFTAWITWESLSRPAGSIMPSNYVIITFQKRPIERTSASINIRGIELPLADYYCLRQQCISKRTPIYKPLSDLWTDIHRLKHNSRRFDHPCQLPPKLMNRLISIYSNPGDFVLDCFNGVGTTTLCAEVLKRKYIGIELIEKYHNTALSRHTDIQLGLDPFRKNDINANQKTKNNEERRVISPIPKKGSLTKKKVQLLIKELSNTLGRIPNEEEALAYLDVPKDFYEKYFKNWGEVTAATKTTGMTEEKISL